MTAHAVSPVAAELTDAERRTALQNLAATAEDMLYRDVMDELAVLAHPSLSWGRRTELFAEYRDLLERAEALAAGMAGWDQECPGLTCTDRQEVAAYTLEDRASEALFTLLHGETK